MATASSLVSLELRGLSGAQLYDVVCFAEDDEIPANTVSEAQAFATRRSVRTSGASEGTALGGSRGGRSATAMGRRGGGIGRKARRAGSRTYIRFVGVCSKGPDARPKVGKRLVVGLNDLLTFLQILQFRHLLNLWAEWWHSDSINALNSFKSLMFGENEVRN